MNKLIGEHNMSDPCFRSNFDLSEIHVQKQSESSLIGKIIEIRSVFLKIVQIPDYFVTCINNGG